MPPLRILVIDDEPRIRATLALCLEGEGYRVVTAASAGEALDAARDPFDVAFLDLRLGPADGLDLIAPLRESVPGLQIVVVTAYASLDTAVEAIRRGAFDYLPKPFTPAQVRLAAEKAGAQRALVAQVETLQARVAAAAPDTEVETASPAMQRILDVARRVAPTDATVLLRGESGTGKGVLARAIHAWSSRAPRPFVTVHAPALSAELLESELFGHTRGAFTGAVRDNAGRVAQAEGGTLFLDEIGDLPLALQPKVLRFLQDREYERVGDPVTRRADVRLIAATNRDLDAMVAEGRFREDLLYRLRVIELTLPPLRERPEDVGPLAEGMLLSLARKYGRPLEGFTPEAEAALAAYGWPGNVRELQNAVERAAILSPGPRVDADVFPLGAVAPTGAARVGGPFTLAELEESHIRHVVATAATLDEAAGTLGIDRATLWRKRKEYGM
ncbi:MAG TPA: sigma-54 dependent transcriptional regulator [Rhodothermales bacterium]|nr:sigma-54 dependent transcriptional regulator [Rhodothermales bacterium]